MRVYVCSCVFVCARMRVCTPPQGEAGEMVGMASTQWVGLMQRLATSVQAVTENRIVTLSERIGEFGGGA